MLHETFLCGRLKTKVVFEELMESCNVSKTASLKDQGVFIRLEGLGKLLGGSEDMRDSRTRTHKGYTGLHRTSVKIQDAKGKL